MSAEILFFPNNRHTVKNSCFVDRKQLFKKLENLIWEDAKSFYWLRASCFNEEPLELPLEVQHKLTYQNLLDQSGLPKYEVCNAMFEVVNIAKTKNDVSYRQVTR